MRSTASDRAAGVLLAAAGLFGLSSGCDGGCRDRPVKRDAAAVADAVGDAVAGDAALGGGADVALDGAGDAGGQSVDGGVAASLCPPWPLAPATGHAWLFARAVSRGVPLSPGGNHVDIYVRAAGAPLPGDRADADDPCAVAAYDRSTTRIRVLAAAIGFSSQDREFSPQRCTDRDPCSVELPPSLDAKYYVASARGLALRVAGDVPQADRVRFAAALGGDSLARAKALHRPFADELARAEQATSVPALEQAIHYTESTLRKRCDASCLDAPALDPAVRSYLKSARRPSHANPFDLRVAPERWPIRER